MITTSSWRGRMALMVAHCAGMVDLVTLPVWVGTLISRYQLEPQKAGLLVTLFLVGAVIASVACAPRFRHLRGRLVATLGFGIAAAGFWGLSTTRDFGLMAALHGLCGLATGAALSVTHGTIARSENPHRLFAIVGVALGVFAVVFLGAIQQVVAAAGGAILFQVFAGVMVFATLVSMVAFPAPDASARSTHSEHSAGALPPSVWLGIGGIACMGLVQSMTFSFLERVGNHRGFSVDEVTTVLIALGLVNLVPAALAAVLEKRWSARKVAMAGPVLQALLVVVIMNTPTYAPYAAAASVFVAVMIFTHTFVFGLLARLDTSGRALAATPAMLMVGAAIGPVLGGTLVQTVGYGSLGAAALLIAVVSVGCFSRLPKDALHATSVPMGIAETLSH